MSLRAFSRALPRVGYTSASSSPFVQARLVSSGAHHDSHAEQETYPPEGFNFAFWRRIILVAGGAAALYKFGPSAEAAGENINALTQYLTVPREHNKRAHDIHLELVRVDADARILTDGAKRPAMIRLKNPTSFENASPHCLPVGQQADLSELRVKADGQ
ncbi:hypothetical protein CTheo_1464 [Ceratobasidium theobromae]|uniref:Uncharacterized protein n=1 Tax=Ceratobasidium theobromae TaxID=1582974 RepID=A0A5N5QVH4_9AGAM|nr:hypothetical protein CTheo_1464 [Ceratobasidium theobromae]